MGGARRYPSRRRLAAEGMKSGMPSWSYTLRTPPEGELEPEGV